MGWLRRIACLTGLAALAGLAGLAALAKLLEHIGLGWVPCAGGAVVKANWKGRLGWLGGLAALVDNCCPSSTNPLEATPNWLPWAFVVCTLTRNRLQSLENTDRVQAGMGHQVPK